MKNTVNLNSINLVNDDSLNYIKTLPDNCIDLIATDPPYFQVKSCSWDNQWENVTAYLSWLDEMLAEFWRVLKPNGSLYMFCGSKLAADTELLLRERFNVLNHIIWAKPSGPWRRACKADLVSEQKLLNREYHELSQQYQLLRRPFTVTVDVPYTDVWVYPPVQYYPGKHPCEKPSAMMEHIINSSSRDGDVVADFFMGSGATIKAALKLNRRVIGVELETDRFEQTKEEIDKTIHLKL
ncbi:site-specific DNA-methyltransferase [Providencia vermicola]|uniref:DNA-methyltransferase n=1 Tax=Providencia vermicola TaxID=333965 RepID=UPI0032DAE9A9